MELFLCIGGRLDGRRMPRRAAVEYREARVRVGLAEVTMLVPYGMRDELAAAMLVQGYQEQSAVA